MIIYLVSKPSQAGVKFRARHDFEKEKINVSKILVFQRIYMTKKVYYRLTGFMFEGREFNLACHVSLHFEQTYTFREVSLVSH
jgi:hypothetical protein